MSAIRGGCADECRRADPVDPRLGARRGVDGEQGVRLPRHQRGPAARVWLRGGRAAEL